VNLEFQSSVTKQPYKGRGKCLTGLIIKKDHKNAKGETAPWSLSMRTEMRLLASSQDKEMAKSSVRARLAGEHGGFKNKSKSA